MEPSGFDDDVVADVVSSLAVVAVDSSFVVCISEDEVRKLILFGSNGFGCTVKLLAFSALALYDLMSS
jgi:hypothetical protein